MFISSIILKVIHFTVLNTKQKQTWEKCFLRIGMYQSNLGIHGIHSPENWAKDDTLDFEVVNSI